jgi:hypothetical protein
MEDDVVVKPPGLILYNKDRRTLDHYDPCTLSLPDYIRLSAEGKAKMLNGKIYLRKDWGLKPVPKYARNQEHTP